MNLINVIIIIIIIVKMMDNVSNKWALIDVMDDGRESDND